MTVMEMRGASRGTSPSVIDGREGGSYEHKFTQSLRSTTEATIGLVKRDLTGEGRHLESAGEIEPWSRETSKPIIEIEREIEVPPGA